MLLKSAPNAFGHSLARIQKHMFGNGSALVQIDENSPPHRTLVCKAPGAPSYRREVGVIPNHPVGPEGPTNYSTGVVTPTAAEEGNTAFPTSDNPSETTST